MKYCNPDILTFLSNSRLAKRANKLLCACIDHEYDWYWSMNCDTEFCVRCKLVIPKEYADSYEGRKIWKD